MHRYSFDKDSIFMVMSHHGNYYISKTCDKALQNNRMPCQAVANKLFVEDLLKQFHLKILFKKVTVMRKGR